jgi:hypothetical protein
MTLTKKPKLENEKNLKEPPTLSFEKIQLNFLKAKQDANRLLKHFDNLMKNYPEVFTKLNHKYPNLEKHLTILKRFFDNFEKHNDERLIMHELNTYNLYANKVNFLLNQINQEEKEYYEKTLTSAVYGEMPFNEIELTETEKRELHNFAEELWKEFFPESWINKSVETEKRELHNFAEELWKEFFPESWINKSVKRATGQKELEWYQKFFLFPANGIESVVIGFINLFKPKTYKELIASIETISGLSYKDWCDLWRGLKFTYEKLSNTDKIAPVLSFIYAVVFLAGIPAQISKIAKKINCSTKTINIIKSAIG